MQEIKNGSGFFIWVFDSENKKFGSQMLRGVQLVTVC